MILTGLFLKRLQAGALKKALLGCLQQGKKGYVPVLLILEDPKRGLEMDFGDEPGDTESEAILPDWQFTDPLEYEISGPMDMIFIKVLQK